jgi:hypothetical protein
VAGDLLEIEELARRSRRVNPGTAVTVVRPAALVGPVRRHAGDQALRGASAAGVRGCAPRWQFCHVDDLVSALELAATRRTVTGDFAVGCDGFALPGRGRGDQRAEVAPSSCPPRLTFGAAQRLHRLGVTPAPASRPALRGVPVGGGLRQAPDAAGWKPSS